jgi:hypothetical protein
MAVRLQLSKKEVKRQLDENGFCVCPNVITPEETEEIILEFRKWQTTIPNHDKTHSTIDPHGIYKHNEVGHQFHAWKTRTNKNVQTYFKYLWNSKELVVSYDGSCFIPKEWKKKDNIWTHTDQAPNKKGLHCIQGFVALTSNKERTLVVYDKSHKLHAKYFEDRGIKSSSNWFKIDHEYLREIQDRKRVLTVPAGSLVLWDSRTFHQNQYGKPNSEERMVQYVCYLPRDHPKYTETIRKKREKYFKERRTTSHWPCPVTVNGLQPQTFGDKSKKIDYSKLTPPDLQGMEEEIKKLI